jgi:hypothetical protein
MNQKKQRRKQLRKQLRNECGLVEKAKEEGEAKNEEELE